MRNLAAYCHPPSPIDKDRDASAYLTDFEVLGVPDHSPFAILYRPREAVMPSTAPKKTGPKPARTKFQKVMGSLREPGDSRFNTAIATRAESDRTLAIAGRGLS
jgi:hypothetical protein